MSSSTNTPLSGLSAEQQMAGDVTGNGALSALDAALILQCKVGLLANLPVACNSSWAFIPVPVSMPGQSVVAPHMSCGSCTMGSISYSPLNTHAADQDYLAIAFGDVTGNWQQGFSQFRGRVPTDAPRVRLASRTVRQTGRTEVRVAVQSAQPYASLDVELRYDPALLRPIGVRKLGAPGALIASNLKESGRVLVALASGQPLDPHAGAPIAVLFESRSGHLASNAVQLEHADVDGGHAPGHGSDD